VTITAPPPAVTPDDTPEPRRPTTPPAAPVTPTVPTPTTAATPLDGRRVAWLTVLWAFVVVFAMVIEVYAFEAIFQARDQRLLLERYRGEIQESVNQTESLFGVDVPVKAPELGAPVGILEIGGTEQGGLGVHQVVVEGVLPDQTAAGPGHVPGTAAPGQPGNSVVVGRHSAFGGTLGDIGYLQKGNIILVSTTQGQSIYRVETVRQQTILPSEGNTANEETGQSSVADVTETADDPTAEAAVPVDVLFGATPDDRLTLITSASSNPFNTSEATVVVARMQGKPYAPTPQNGRVDSQTGLAGDPSALAPVLLALLAYGAAVVGAVVLYQRSSSRAAYLLTVPPLLVCTVVTAETVSRLLPAWT
jgi:sortase A